MPPRIYSEKLEVSQILKVYGPERSKRWRTLPVRSVPLPPSKHEVQKPHSPSLRHISFLKNCKLYSDGSKRASKQNKSKAIHIHQRHGSTQLSPQQLRTIQSSKLAKGYPYQTEWPQSHSYSFRLRGAGELTHLAFVSMYKNKMGEGTDDSSVHDLIQRLRVSASCSLGSSQVSVPVRHTAKHIYTHAKIK